LPRIEIPKNIQDALEIPEQRKYACLRRDEGS